MLLYDTARPGKVHSGRAPSEIPIPAPVGATPATTPEPPAVPFARFPHALAADRRLSPTDRLVACALLWWARGDRSTAEMSNRALAEYVGVSIPTVERSLRRLAALGYVRAEAVRATPANMTGRVVALRWVEDPSILPAQPARAARATAEAPPSAVMGPHHRPRGEGPIIGDGPPPSPAMAKEDRPVEEAEEPKNVRAIEVERQRPEAVSVAQVEPIEPTVVARMAPVPRAIGDPATASPTPAIMPPAVAVDRAVLEARQLAALTAGPGGESCPGSRIAREVTPDPTPGQVAALGAMSPEQLAAFERKSPGMQAQILAPFAGGFDPRIFEGVARAQLAVPRFAARARPVERTTAGLVEAVAGGDPRHVAELAESICRDLGGAGDRRRWGAIYKLAEQLLRREVDPDTVLDALRQAMGPGSKNRGAVFTTALRRGGWRPGGAGSR